MDCNKYFVFGILLIPFSTLCFVWFNNSMESDSYAQLNQSYDFIIVGGGSAGCVMARRLADLAGVRVLLLEAGPRPNFLQRFLSDTPILVPLMLGGSMDWFYSTSPQRFAAKLLKENRIILPAGKILGGTSMINAMIVSRGHPSDYDGWGVPGWAFKDIKHFLEPSNSTKSLESAHASMEEVLQPAPIVQRLSSAIRKAATQSGYDISNTGFNGWSLNGFTIPLVNLHNGQRVSTYSAYLRGYRSPQLTIIPESFVRSVILDEDSKAARGVIVERRSGEHQVHLREGGEVILAAGSISSPAILMRSGIGDTEKLERIPGIKPVVNNSAVGANFHDHPMLPLYVSINTSATITARKIANPVEIVRYLLRKEGLWAQASGLITVGYLRTHRQRISGNPAPDIQYYVVGVGSVDFGVFKKMANFGDQAWADFLPPQYAKSDEGFLVTTVLLNPKSRGTVSLNAQDPRAMPTIDPNYFEEEEDVERLREGVRMIMEMLRKGDELSEMGAQIHLPDYELCRNHDKNSDSYLDCLIRSSSLTVYHPVGSCRFGAKGDPRAALDEELRLKGVRSLRVVDASVFPAAPSGNPNTPLRMIAEVAAERIATARRGMKSQ